MKFNRETIATLEHAVPSSGLALISSGTITDPVAFFDITLPAGYAFFKGVLIVNLAETTGFGIAEIAGAFSFDGGETYLNDTTNFDSYTMQDFTSHRPPAPFTTALDGGLGDDPIVDSMFYFGEPQSFLSSGSPALTPGISEFFIFPGSETQFFMVWANNSNEEIGLFNIMAGRIDANRAAIVAPMPGRANLLRVQSYGNGDCNPPTSGDTLTGSFFLFGVPTP